MMHLFFFFISLLANPDLTDDGPESKAIEEVELIAEPESEEGVHDFNSYFVFFSIL